MSAPNDPGMHMSALQPQTQPQSYDPSMQPQSHMVASNLANTHHDTASCQPQTFSNINGVAPATSSPKRKRGRPRKLNVNTARPLAIMPAPYPTGLRGVALVSPQARKRRMAAAGPAVIGFYPEVITIQVGEDILAKVTSFSGNGWAACIMSAIGAVSRVTLGQGASSHEIVIYEGYFEIISLSGSYQPSETGGMCSHRGGISVWLAGLDGRVFGGGVAGPLTAASPVQVVIGRFPVDDKKKLKRVVIPGASSSTLGGALNGSSGMQA